MPYAMPQYHGEFRSYVSCSEPHLYIMQYVVPMNHAVDIHPEITSLVIKIKR